MSDRRAFAKCKVDTPAAKRGKGVSIPFLGTNNQAHWDLLRQKLSAKVVSAGSDWMRLAVIMGAQRPPKKTR